MNARDADSLLELLRKRGLHGWVAGGWAVDALVGEQTRNHGDLDLAVKADELTEVIGALDDLGYRITTDSLPSRVELADNENRRVDLHPVRFRADGSGSQAGPDETSFESTERTASPPAPSTVTACPVFPGHSSSAFVKATTGGAWITMMCP